MKRCFRRQGILYRKAEPGDEPVINTLLDENPMDSWVRLTFRYSDPLAASNIIIAEDEYNGQNTIGLYSLDTLPLHINGAVRNIGYIGRLRIARHYRHRLRILKGGYESIEHLFPDQSEPGFWLTSLASENSTARRLLETNLKGMPFYRFAGSMSTHVISTRHAKNSGLLRPAEMSDIPALTRFLNCHLSAFQFSPAVSDNWLSGLPYGLSLQDFLILENGNSITGCVAVWDQRQQKQIYVDGYRSPYLWLRPIYNFWASLSGRARLPRIGQQLNHVYLSFLAFAPADQNLFVTSIRDALSLARLKGADIAITGVSSENPDSAILRQAFKSQIYSSSIETVAWRNEQQPDLDGRLIQSDIAML